jgi:transposase
MEVLYPRCCGLDVHKSSIAACVLLREQGRIRTERRRFTTMTQDLETLATWLRQLQVTHVAIESTGVYWKQVWNILDGHFTNILANAQHVKNVPSFSRPRDSASWTSATATRSFTFPQDFAFPISPVRGLADPYPSALVRRAEFVLLWR